MVVFRLCSECSLCSFGNFPGVRSIKTDVSELNVGSIVLGDGTDIEFRNVGFYTSEAGEIPKRTQSTKFIYFPFRIPAAKLTAGVTLC